MKSFKISILDWYIFTQLVGPFLFGFFMFVTVIAIDPLMSALQNIVNESVELVLSGSNVKGIVDVPDATHAVDADEGQLSQVLHNIIINASQSMPGGGTLTVSAQNETLADANIMFLRPGSYVRLTISDQGCGMPEEVMTKIFDPYFTTTSAGNGYELGERDLRRRTNVATALSSLAPAPEGGLWALLHREGRRRAARRRFDSGHG